MTYEQVITKHGYEKRKLINMFFLHPTNYHKHEIAFGLDTGWIIYLCDGVKPVGRLCPKSPEEMDEQLTLINSIES